MKGKGHDGEGDVIGGEKDCLQLTVLKRRHKEGEIFGVFFVKQTKVP